MTVAITSVLDKPIQERKLRLHQGDEEDYIGQPFMVP